jgi:hypothetical protein
MPGRTQGTQFEIAGNRANLATAALELNQNSTLATSLETASQIMERGASHPIGRRGAFYHRLTITTLRLGAWTLMLRARAALSAAGP